MVAWVLGTVNAFLVLLKFAFGVPLDLLRGRSCREDHLTTLPSVLPLARHFCQQLGYELLDGPSLACASITNNQHRELMPYYSLHDILLLNRVLSRDHYILEFDLVLELFIHHQGSASSGRHLACMGDRIFVV